VKEYRSRTPIEVIQNDILEVHEKIDFYNRAAGLLIAAGYPGEYVSGEIGRYMDRERDWPEGKRAYRLLFEKFTGEAIAHKMGLE
jgi:hypothetical protein